MKLLYNACMRLRIPPVYLHVSAASSSFYFFLCTIVRHDDTSAPYFPRVFFAVVVIVYCHRTGRTILIAKSIFLRAVLDTAGVPRHHCLLLIVTVKFFALNFRQVFRMTRQLPPNEYYLHVFT